MIFSFIPVCIGILIIISYILYGNGKTSTEISQSIALLAVFLGGGNRFFRGIKDIIFRKEVTIDVFVSISLIVTIFIGEFLSAAIIIFIMAVAGAVEGYIMDKSNRTIHALLSSCKAGRKNSN